MESMSKGNGHSTRAATAAAAFTAAPVRLAQLGATVSLQADHLLASITDARPETFELLDALSPAQREQWVLEAWRIGVSALSIAYRQGQESRLQEIGKDLLENFERAGGTVIESITTRLKQGLSSYFDPQSGLLTERLDRLTNDSGEVATVMRRVLDEHLSENGALSRLLDERVGQNSPLLRLLDPENKRGVVQHMVELIRDTLQHREGELAQTLDPHNEAGPVGRFLHSLKLELKAAHESREAQLATALAALDANNADSLLNRLVRDTTAIQAQLVQALNADSPNSPLAQIKASLTALLVSHFERHEKALAAQNDRQEKLGQDIREAMARLETRRDETSKSPRGGIDFEDAVTQFVTDACVAAPIVAEPTGHTTGMIRHCKKGDLLLRFTDESAFAGSAIVIEAKRDASYTVAKALAELDIARNNRGAQAALFVMAKSHAPAGFPTWKRYGSDVLVVWDPDDPTSDIRLQTTLSLALALAPRREKSADDGDITALADVHQRIEELLGDLEKIHTANDRILRSANDIAETLRKGNTKLERLLKKAETALKALNVELHDEDAERECPIGLEASAADAA